MLSKWKSLVYIGAKVVHKGINNLIQVESYVFGLDNNTRKQLFGRPGLPALWIVRSRYMQNRDGADGGCWLSVIISNIVDLTMF